MATGFLFVLGREQSNWRTRREEAKSSKRRTGKIEDRAKGGNGLIIAYLINAMALLARK